MNALNRDLKKLVNFIEKNEKERVNKDYWRLKFHLMPPVGWLNDPNGLCEFNGEYHIFYQYSPFDANGGIKLWGHYTSKDFINYKNNGTEIFADQPFDCHGAYSGSTIVHNGKMNIFYTGNVKHVGEHDYISSGRGHNTVLLVSEDGKTLVWNLILGEENHIVAETTMLNLKTAGFLFIGLMAVVGVGFYNYKKRK